MLSRTLPATLAGILTLGTLTSTALAAGACQVRSPAAASTVVELYTSEGCSSCPPADQWLSRVQAQPGVVALAFHVDYWDRLGWTDRFGSPAYTQRQYTQAMLNGARFAYTPQVVVDGIDRKDWPVPASQWSVSRRPLAPVVLTLSRDGAGVSATVEALPGVPARLAAYWTVTENGHVSAVKSGENAGVTLKHDAVVRDYLQRPAWTAQPGVTVTLQFMPAASSDATHAREVSLVVVNADTGRPVQALKLGC